MSIDPKDIKKSDPNKSEVKPGFKEGKKSEDEKNHPKIEVEKKHSVGDDNEKMKESEVTADNKDLTETSTSSDITNDDRNIVNKHHGEDTSATPPNNNV